MQHFKRIICGLLGILLLLACSPKKPAAKIELLSAHAGETVAINDVVISTYLHLPVSESLAYLKENAYKTKREMINAILGDQKN